MKAIVIKEFQYNRHLTSFGMVAYNSIEPNTEVRVLDGKDSDANSIYGVDYGVCALGVLPTGENVYIPYTYLIIIYLSRVERGLTIPSISMFYRMVSAMGLNVELH